MRITDPDEHSVSFEYTSTWYLTRRVDRRNAVTTFAYRDTRFILHRRHLSATDTLITRLGTGPAMDVVAATPVADVNLTMDGPRTDVSDVTTWWLDRWGAPVRIRDAYGAVTQVTRGDPRWPAHVTQVLAPNGLLSTASYDGRGNPASQTVWSPYGDGRHATTTYQWDPVWDAVTQVTLPEGEVTLAKYDSVGRREWDQTGPNSARRVTYHYNPKTHSTAPGLVERVVLPGGAAERYEYDARGNLSAVVSPLLIRTEYASDRLGRAVAVRRPTEESLVAIDSTYYDPADRPWRSVTAAPAVPGTPAQRLVVHNEYDAEDNLLSVSRWSEPDTARIGVVRTEFKYDTIGRRIAELAPDGAVDSLFYDKAGNVVRLRTRRHAEIMKGLGAVHDSMGYVRMRYDRQNRLIERIVPPTVYDSLEAGLALRGFIYPWEMMYVNTYFPGRTRPPPYPWYPTNTSNWSYRIPGDTIVFGYDNVTGWMVQADNREALIRRSYYPNGALRRDSLYVRTVAEVPSRDGIKSAHPYGLELSYDRNGRRTELRHPGQLAPSTLQDRTVFGYDPGIGTVRFVRDPLGNDYGYRYNLSGQLDTIIIPGGIRDNYRYDQDGRLETRIIQNGSMASSRWPAAWLRDAALQYDVGGKIRQISNRQGLGDTLMLGKYSGIGHLISGLSQSIGIDGAGNRINGYSHEESRYDALGNRHASTTSTSYVRAGETWSPSTSSVSQYYRYEAGTGRLAVADTVGQYEAHSYDAAGNLRFVTQLRPTPNRSLPLRDRAFFYDATNQLRATEYREVSDPSLDEQSPYVRAFEEYRYDALGRRIWVRARRNCQEPEGFTAECRLGQAPPHRLGRGPGTLRDPDAWRG